MQKYRERNVYGPGPFSPDLEPDPIDHTLDARTGVDYRPNCILVPGQPTTDTDLAFNLGTLVAQ